MATRSKKRAKTVKRKRDRLVSTKKLARPTTNPYLIVGDPDELIHFDWSKFWNPVV